MSDPIILYWVVMTPRGDLDDSREFRSSSLPSKEAQILREEIDSKEGSNEECVVLGGFWVGFKRQAYQSTTQRSGPEIGGLLLDTQKLKSSKTECARAGEIFKETVERVIAQEFQGEEPLSYDEACSALDKALGKALVGYKHVLASNLEIKTPFVSTSAPTRKARAQYVVRTAIAVFVLVAGGVIYLQLDKQRHGVIPKSSSQGSTHADLLSLSIASAGEPVKQAGIEAISRFSSHGSAVSFYIDQDNRFLPFGPPGGSLSRAATRLLGSSVDVALEPSGLDSWLAAWSVLVGNASKVLGAAADIREQRGEALDSMDEVDRKRLFKHIFTDESIGIIAPILCEWPKPDLPPYPLPGIPHWPNEKDIQILLDLDGLLEFSGTASWGPLLTNEPGGELPQPGTSLEERLASVAKNHRLTDTRLGAEKVQIAKIVKDLPRATHEEEGARKWLSRLYGISGEPFRLKILSTEIVEASQSLQAVLTIRSTNPED